MTAGQQASANFAGGKAISVTIGTPDGAAFGYSSAGGWGAAAPNTYGGFVINQLVSQPTADFAIGIGGGSALPKNFFDKITVQGTNGVLYEFASASAFHSPGGTTVWFFGSGTAKVWTATAPSPRSVIITPNK